MAIEVGPLNLDGLAPFNKVSFHVAATGDTVIGHLSVRVAICTAVGFDTCWIAQTLVIDTSNNAY